jgi:PAS domain S-box-containing protein
MKCERGAVACARNAGTILGFPSQLEPQAEAALGWRVTSGFAVAVLLTGLLGFFSWQNARQVVEDADWVSHTQQVMTRLEAALRHLLDVETGGRGFALTGERQFLEPYESGRAAIVQDLQSLRLLLEDNPDQSRRLQVLEEQARTKIEDVQDIVTASQVTGGATVAMFERGKRIMDTVRITVAQMEATERSLLEQRNESARRAQRFSSSVILAGSLFGAVFLSIAGGTVRREIGVSAKARAQISALNADLERQVEERTAALGESEGRLAGIIHSAMDAIITVDERQTVLLFNAAAESIFRCPAAEALGQSITRFIPQRFHAAHAGHIKKFGEHGVTSRALGALDTLWGVRADGEEFQIEASISQAVTLGKKLFTVILRDVTERRQAEQIREQLAAVVDSSDDAIIGKTLDGIVTAWNRGAEKVFGYPAAEVIGKSVQILIPAERAAEEADILARIRRGESVKHFETVRVRKDGEKIDVSVTISPIRDSSGVIVGASKIARDITERKRAEAALRESEERLQAVAHGIPQLAWMAEADGSIFWYNQRWYDYTGTTLEQMQGWGWQSVHRPEMLPTVLKGWKNAIATGQPFEMEFPLRAANGEFRTLLTRVMPVKGADGRVVRWFGTNTDISERKQAEEQLAGQAAELARQADELARSRTALEKETLMLTLVLDSVGEGLIAADPEGHFLIWNDSAKKMLGRGPVELPPEQWSSHYACYEADGVRLVETDRLPLMRALKGESLEVEFMVRPPGNEPGVFLEFTVRPMKDAHGKVCGGVVAFRDTTERRAAEREIRALNNGLELRVAERTAELEAANTELESFTYSVSHDLRAPLRHIAGFAGLLAEEYGDKLEAQAQHYLKRITEGTRKMGQLVDELLTLARVGRQAVSMQVTGLDSIVKEIVEMLKPDYEGRNVEWKIAQLPFVECDPALMKQVFQNLISNALKYSRPREKTVIEIGQVEIQDRGNSIFVRDNGVGFSMKYVDKLFGVFQRLHRAEDFEGTGVGLATVQRIIHKHGGKVWAEAALDRGATFYFTLAEAGKEELRTTGAAIGARA